MDIDDLYDDDDVIVEGQQEEQTPLFYSLEYQQESNTNDFLADFLRTKGIEDPSKIAFEEEDGSIVERDWNSLTREEQINIANTTFEQPSNTNSDFEFDNEELDLINQIRLSGLTPSQYLSQLQGDQIIKEPIYKIDDLSDDEIFLLDLESRVGELSEDEGILALTNAKQNEELYKKQIEGIRKEYKEREDFLSQLEQAQLELQQKEAFDVYQANVVNAIDSFTSIGNLDLNFEDDDKEELAEFILSQDENGINYLYQALQDPVNLVKAAWFILNGDEAFDNVADYFTSLIKLVGENQYKKGLADAQNNSSRPTVVVDNTKRNVTSLHKTYDSIDELFD